MSHYNMVQIHEKTVALDGDWSKRRTKQLSLCGMVIYTTIHFVDRTLQQFNTPQIIHVSCAAITSEVTSNTLHPPHISESLFIAKMLILYFVQDWSENNDFARVMASSRHLTRFAEGPMAQSYTCTRRVKRQKP